MKRDETSSLGMWTFLASEMMLFGTLLLVYTVARCGHPQAFARGAHELLKYVGAANTALLLSSSTTMALAVEARQARRAGWLLLTALLGGGFLAVKGYEWSLDVANHRIPGPSFADPDPGLQLFYWCYLVLTGVHAVHLTLGIVAVSLTAASRSAGDSQVRSVGLYWHLVDLIWIFLYPLFYLIGAAR